MVHQVETMAYAGNVPWHGLGKAVSSEMTPEEMLVEAGLNWTVSKRPSYTTNSPDVMNLLNPAGEANFLHVPDHFHLVRDSDNTILSSCGDKYEPFQNHEVMDFFKRFTDAGEMQMETAGSLRNGKDIWGLAKLSEKFAVTLPGNDKVESYLLLNSPHVSGTALTIMLTPIRVVCNNTLTMALKDQTSKFRVLHLQMFDEEIMRAAEEALGLSSKTMSSFKDAVTLLSKKKATNEAVGNFVAELFAPNILIERGKAANENSLPPIEDELKHTASRVHEAIYTSPGAELAAAKGTWWGALNGVTYVVDHESQARTEDNSLHSAWFGSGAAKKRKALSLAIDYAQAA